MTTSILARDPDFATPFTVGDWRLSLKTCRSLEAPNWRWTFWWCLLRTEMEFRTVDLRSETAWPQWLPGAGRNARTLS